ncbi:MAG: hypothetical protein IJB26_04470 [Clostridia bacterium]|nr:hypothetical protein [Clostridia bacterium]
MNIRIPLCIVLTTAICTFSLLGCDRTSNSSALAENSESSSDTTSSVSSTEDLTASVTSTAAEVTTSQSTTSRPTSTTGQNTSATKTSSVSSTTSAASTTSTTAVSTTTTTTTTTTQAPTNDPNRATVNGKVFAIGDTIQYTVMVKTAENFGRAKIAVRYAQKGLEVPNGLPIKQQQAVMSNLGIGMLIGPEETTKETGFIITSNKGFSIDSTVPGYAGLTRFYETTNYDSNTQSYRPIDCSHGVTLYAITLKITKPGDYLVDCFEYPSKSRTDLTVWGEITA